MVVSVSYGVHMWKSVHRSAVLGLMESMFVILLPSHSLHKPDTRYYSRYQVSLRGRRRGKLSLPRQYCIPGIRHCRTRIIRTFRFQQYKTLKRYHDTRLTSHGRIVVRFLFQATSLSHPAARSLLEVRSSSERTLFADIFRTRARLRRERGRVQTPQRWRSGWSGRQ